MKKLRSLFLAGFLFVALPLASSFAAVGISVNIAPPVLPVYEQPPCPVAGYLWNPGYWAYGVGDYYWVPGGWVAPPAVGLLWTPPWWRWNNGVYVFNRGYWGPTVGFYGGINYGHGYWGDGYWGGRWEGNAFRYNTAVTRVNTTVVHNTFVDRNVMNKEVNQNRAAFNGPNGVKAEANAEQRAAAANAKKMPATSEQRARQEAAAKDRNLQASVNKGQPNADAINSFDKREQHGKGAGAEHGKGAGVEGPGTAAGAGKADKPGNVSERHREGAGDAEAHGNRQNVEGSKAKARSDNVAKHEGSARGQPEMTQKSRHPQMSAAGTKTGGKRAQATGPQQKGKKKSGKPEKQRGRY